MKGNRTEVWLHTRAGIDVFNELASLDVPQAYLTIQAARRRNRAFSIHIDRDYAKLVAFDSVSQLQSVTWPDTHNTPLHFKRADKYTHTFHGPLYLGEPVPEK